MKVIRKDDSLAIRGVRVATIKRCIRFYFVVIEKTALFSFALGPQSLVVFMDIVLGVGGLQDWN